MGIAIALGLVGLIPGTALAGPGAQPSCGDVLNADTTLTADLDCSSYAGNGLSMAVAGITLDLNGYRIIGYTGVDSYYGVVNNADQSTITNGTIEDFRYGVFLVATTHATVSWVVINGEAADTQDIGLLDGSGTGNMIKHLTVAGVLVGMLLTDATDDRIARNTVTASNVAFGIEDSVRNTIISNTAIGQPGSTGFYNLRGARNQYIANKANGGAVGFELFCDGNGKVVLNFNTAKNNTSHGFRLYRCHSATSSNGSAVIGNTANYNGTGFADQDSVKSMWTYNRAEHNDNDGFNFNFPDGYVIKFNVARRNGDAGFELANNAQPNNASRFSYNIANMNQFGHYAEFKVRGMGNRATNNSSEDCHNVSCV
jgi:copper-binding protein NosD